MPQRRSQLAEATLAVIGADHPLAAPTCVHLASTGARLLLTGASEDRLLEVDAQLSQSELHLLLPSEDPAQVGSWLAEQTPRPQGLVAFSSTLDPEQIRSLLAPVALALGATATTLEVVIVCATEPNTTVHLPSPLPDLELDPLRVSWLTARNVVALEVLAEIDARVQAGEATREALLTTLFGTKPPAQLLTSKDLGLWVETLLGSFSRFARGRHYTFDALG